MKLIVSRALKVEHVEYTLPIASLDELGRYLKTNHTKLYHVLFNQKARPHDFLSFFLNKQFVSNNPFETVPLCDNDELEIITSFAGG